MQPAEDCAGVRGRRVGRESLPRAGLWHRGRRHGGSNAWRCRGVADRHAANAAPAIAAAMLRSFAIPQTKTVFPLRFIVPHIVGAI